MNKKIFILSFLLFPSVIILTGCQSSANKDEFLKNNECIKHRETIDREIDKYNKENKARSYLGMGETVYSEEIRRFLDVFYNTKTNSCLYAVNETIKQISFNLDGEPSKRELEAINGVSKGTVDTDDWRTYYKLCLINVSSGREIGCIEKKSESDYITNDELEKIIK